MSSLRWQRVTRDFGGGEGVFDVDLEVRAGELLVLLGPSGSGKSTLLRLAGGFDRPDTGRVWLGSEDVTEQPPERRPTAMVFQTHALWPHLSVFDNVAFGLQVRRRPRAEVRARVRELLLLVGLDGVEKRFPRQLSGGQRQRVALARALAVRPEVLLLDEPMSSLDVQLRHQLRTELRSIQAQLGTTMVYVTHDQEDALALGDRLAVLNRGSIVQVGTPEDVYERPRTVFVAWFCGSTLLLECCSLPAEDVARCVQLTDGTRLRIAGGNATGGWVAIRAEALRVVCTPGPNCLPAQVVRTRYVDGRNALELTTPVGEMNVLVAAPGPRPGEKCYVELPSERLWQVQET